MDREDENGHIFRDTKRVARGMDVVYVCGCFNAYGRYALSLKRDGKIQGRLIVASMGLFADGAFRIKYAKKKLYMILTNLFGLYRRMEWSASTEEEAANIAKHVWAGLITILQRICRTGCSFARWRNRTLARN